MPGSGSVEHSKVVFVYSLALDTIASASLITNFTEQRLISLVVWEVLSGFWAAFVATGGSNFLQEDSSKKELPRL